MAEAQRKIGARAAGASALTAKVVTIIEARPKSVPAQLRALWRYRHLYWPLMLDLSVKKYRGMMLGIWWVVIRPIVPMTIAVFTFTVVTSVETDGIPYIIFYLSGAMTWTLFQSTMNFGARTLMWTSGIVQKTYFPKLMIPLASLGVPVLEFLVVFVLFIVALVAVYFKTGFFYLRIDAAILLLPVMFFMATLMSLAIGMVLDVIALLLRDVLYTLTYVIQLFMFLTPVFYPMSAIPEGYRWLVYLINPLAAIMETTRWSITGHGEMDVLFLLYSCVSIMVMFAVSVLLFFRAEDYLGELI